MKQKPLITDPKWCTKQNCSASLIPSPLSSWLFDQASLTARLLAICKGNFHVEVIDQSWQQPFLNEARRLNRPQRQVALIRQVYLFCDDIPLVYARTVMPRKTLTGRCRYLANLGRKPLGAVLFADPTMRRDPVEVTQLQPGQYLFESAVAILKSKPKSIWGRRSVFYLHRKPLLVNEIFLPSIEQFQLPELL